METRTTDIDGLDDPFPKRDEPDEGIQSRIARELRRALVDPHGAPERQVTDIVGQPIDRVATFGSVVMAMRLATTAIGLLLAAGDIFAGNTKVIATMIAVVIYATFRSFNPIRYTGDLSSLAQVVFEVGLHVAAVGLTGGWASPFVFSLITAVSIAGFARGYGFALRIATASALAVSLPIVLSSNVDMVAYRACATWSGMLLFISIVAGYGRRISGEADRERDLALDRLSRLADANALLYSLHRVAQTLPASLDMNEVLESTVGRLRGLIDFDTLVILLFDETDGHWVVVRKEGCNLKSRLGPTDLPAGLRSAIAQGGVISMPALGMGNEGFDDRSGSGLYAPLTTRDSIMGLIALEHREPSRFDHRAGGLLSGFVPPLSLAMDNARWFARLRTVGADEERTRIARDLHDRIGQSLAYLAFELDRIVTKDQSGEKVSDSLERLRDDVRGVIREVRDTLYDLRTDVSDDQSLASILEQYAERVRERTSLDVQVEADKDDRLPILQEREMWRITQEAITNIERHAKATRVRITWRCDGDRAAVRITDNGVGFEIGRAGRLDSYGMLGMRERASSVGATLDIHSVPGQGTSITCVLDPAADSPTAKGKEKESSKNASRGPIRSASPQSRELLSDRSTPMNPIRLMLADDHRMLREGLRRSMIEEGFDVVGEARDGVEAVALAEQLLPDVILMDVSMPNCDGVEACRQVKSRGTASKVVMLTMHADKEVLTNAIRAGASGYLVKDCSTGEIAEAVRMAAAGDTVLSPQLAKSMLDEVRRLDEKARTEEERMVTKREEEVLQLIADGCSTPEVAAELFISQKTVKNHLASIYQKLDARDRTQAVLQAVRMGIVHLD